MASNTGRPCRERSKSRKLDLRTARSELKPRACAALRSLDKKLHLGYRRDQGKAGTRWARHYLGSQSSMMSKALALPTILATPDGAEIFDYWQAAD